VCYTNRKLSNNCSGSGSFAAGTRAKEDFFLAAAAEEVYLFRLILRQSRKIKRKR
jgi:hypothetical protein